MSVYHEAAQVWSQISKRSYSGSVFNITFSSNILFGKKLKKTTEIGKLLLYFILLYEG